MNVGKPVKTVETDSEDDSADEEDYTDNLKLQKSELVAEEEESERSKKCCSDCGVVMRYLIVE